MPVTGGVQLINPYEAAALHANATAASDPKVSKSSVDQTSTIQSLAPTRQREDSQKSFGLWGSLKQHLATFFWGAPDKNDPLFRSDDEVLFGKQSPFEPVERKSTRELFDQAMAMFDHLKEMERIRKDPLQKKVLDLMRFSIEVAKLRWKVSQERITQGTADLTELMQKQRELRDRWIKICRECEDKQDRSWILNQMKDWFQAAGFFATGAKVLAGTQFALPVLVVGGLAFFSTKVSDAGLRLAANCYSTIASIGDQKGASARAKKALSFLMGVSQAMLSMAYVGAGGAALFGQRTGPWASIAPLGSGGLELANAYGQRLVNEVEAEKIAIDQASKEREREQQEHQQELRKAQEQETDSVQGWAETINRQLRTAQFVLRKEGG